MQGILQRDFRWKLIIELVAYSKQLDQNYDRDEAEQSDPIVSRFHELSAECHHWDTLKEYVTKDELDNLHKIHADDLKKPPTKYPRTRDAGRLNRQGKPIFRNPYWTSGTCVVCWAKKKQVYTTKYCRECSLQSKWTYKLRHGESFEIYAPRLCSKRCWDIFHSGEIHGLDHHHRKRKRTRTCTRRALKSNASTPQPVRRTNRPGLSIEFRI